MSKRIQIVRIYDGDVFVGLDVTVHGETIGNVLSTTVVSKQEECPNLLSNLLLVSTSKTSPGMVLKLMYQ